MSSIEKKKKEREGNDSDADFSSFFLHGVTLSITVVFLSFLSAIFMHNLSLYSRVPLAGRKLYAPPYTPANAKAFDGQHGGSDFFNNLFNMDKWGFPYKNFFTTPYPKTDQEAKNNWWWRIGSWVWMSIAYSFANGRNLLQEIFAGLHSVSSTGKFSNIKSNILFMHAQIIASLLIILTPIYSILSTIYALGKNAYKLMPNNLWIFLIMAIPILLFIIGAGGIIVTGVTIVQMVMLLLFLMVYPLVTTQGLAEIGECMYERRSLIIKIILFHLTLLAFYDLDSTKGLAFLIVFFAYLFRLI